jgi:hypothetical protein
MREDKIVEQTRKTREKICAEFDYDMKKYLQYIIKEQKKNSNRLITPEQMKNNALSVSK